MHQHRDISSGSVASSTMHGIVETTSPHQTNSHTHFSWCSSAHGDSASSVGYPSYDATTQVAHTPSWTDTPHYPHTPPPLDHWKSPHATISLPSEGQQTRLNPMLLRARFPSIIWDLGASTRSAHCLTHPTTHWRDARASTPARRYLDIRSSLVDRPISVFSSAQTFVTIGDVLEAISNAIREMDRRRWSPFQGEIPGDAVRAAEPRLAIGLGMADHQNGNSDHGGGATALAHATAGDHRHARAMMWGGLVESPTESNVWILFVN